ncbi:glycine zipper 2TM domain-containing protein [Duganella sp. FT80W]|jgi:outer membrane lipoprotein SlyB|uniref:Glycine zipper 2TM domain-containing protein n=1 Tax=Duganella guangzhouensis TaxID=2666084 RepID=A0A6I2L7Y3_9BURK|nr:glycine zipper 2TM domain-containing protein [Duganella guangzhouensis]MRW94248.1 glycine zipper 2TM domain-containing protein [Duganella guangzhouensis]
MDTPHIKSSPHPVMVIAAVAVVLFCGVGSAAILGWLPTSNASVPAAVSGLPPAPEHASNASYNNAAPTANSMAPTGSAEPALAQGAGQNAEPEARNAPCANCGVVESVRAVEHRPQSSGVGAVGGAVLGGLLGNQVGSGHGRQLATVAGAVGGAVAGNQIEGNMKTTHSWDIVVRMDNGNKRTLHASNQPQWRAGDPVRIVKGQLRSID